MRMALTPAELEAKQRVQLPFEHQGQVGVRGQQAAPWPQQARNQSRCTGRAACHARICLLSTGAARLVHWLQGAGSSADPGAPRLGWAGVVRALVKEEGVPGLWRGLAPRILSVALWGTVMVNSYEALKRLAALPPPPPPSPSDTSQ